MPWYWELRRPTSFARREASVPDLKLYIQLIAYNWLNFWNMSVDKLLNIKNLLNDLFIYHIAP